MDCCGKRRRRWAWVILLAVVVIVVLLAMLSDARGQTPANGAPAAITNQTCPVTIDEPIDPEQWIEYEGQRIYFCCRMCKRKFEREPQAYLVNLPQFAEESAMVNGGTVPGDGQEADAHGGHAHEADAQTGHDAESDHAHGHAASTGDHASTAALAGNGALTVGDDESSEHDHAAHEPGSGQASLTKLVYWLGNFHPPSVNFPIALLLSGAIAELLLMVTGRSLFEAAARFCVWLGSVSTMGAVLLGWFFAGFKLSDPDWIMTVHRWLGTAAGVWAILILVLCMAAHQREDRSRRWKPWYRLTLFVGAAAVAANGFFGGAMIYGLDHYAW